MRVQIVQVNIRHSEVVWTLLEKVVRERRIELVAVQEALLSALRDEGKWEGFDFLFSTQGGRHPKLH